MSLELGCENEINEILQSWIRKKEREIRDKQQGCTIGFKENLPNISSPHQARTKGAPKKRVKNALENTTIKYNNNKNRQDMMKLNVKAPNKQSRSELQPEIPIRQTKYICSYCKVVNLKRKVLEQELNNRMFLVYAYKYATNL
uniref:Uncharacterized protein n=1 Tax=Rhizophagus irregularis (strain DAOM 181602 / DAOM 197198 / MUCL 43194) TaxID=747089 RepID=U9SYN6_RHIID